MGVLYHTICMKVFCFFKYLIKWPERNLFEKNYMWIKKTKFPLNYAIFLSEKMDMFSRFWKKTSSLMESCCTFTPKTSLENTVKPVNKGHPRERSNLTFIDKWSVFWGYFVLLHQRKVIKSWVLFTTWPLIKGGL